MEKYKIWLNRGELCVAGNFTSKRNDLTITKLNDMLMTINFIGENGTVFQFVGSPVRLPLCRILAGQQKKLTLNFEKFDRKWKEWNTTQHYIFS